MKNVKIKLLNDFSDRDDHPKKGDILVIEEMHYDDDFYLESVIAVALKDNKGYLLYPYEYEELNND
ncbi:hypothetical protein [Escherichia phage UPEC06]|nr:hypothetical protein [Escherichia phage UPEC06]